MKKFLFIVGIVVLAGAIFVGGLVLGTQHDFMNAMFQVNTVEKELVDLANHFHAVRYLDKGQPEDARDFLNDRVDGHVSTIGTLLDDCPNPDTKVHASKMLATIARHRQQFPPERKTIRTLPDHEKYTSYVDETLAKALETEKTEQDCSTVSAEGASSAEP
jgi:hypothetical protein